MNGSRRASRTRWLAGIVALVAVGASGCRCNVGGGPGAGPSAGPFAPMAKSGPATWRIDGIPQQVASTYYLGLPDGVQFTLDYRVPDDVSFDSISKEAALAIAMPLMKHVVANKLHLRVELRDGSGNRA